MFLWCCFYFGLHFGLQFFSFTIRIIIIIILVLAWFTLNFLMILFGSEKNVFSLLFSLVLLCLVFFLSFTLLYLRLCVCVSFVLLFCRSLRYLNNLLKTKFYSIYKPVTIYLFFFVSFSIWLVVFYCVSFYYIVSINKSWSQCTISFFHLLLFLLLNNVHFIRKTASGATHMYLISSRASICVMHLCICICIDVFECLLSFFYSCLLHWFHLNRNPCEPRPFSHIWHENCNSIIWIEKNYFSVVKIKCGLFK